MAKKPAQNRPQKMSHPKVTRPGSAVMGDVRIIGGDWRGRKLPVLMAEGLRPTSDRVRETLFNWLRFDVAGSHCLDLFAGSGALGFEALSRGAKSVTFLELSIPVAQQLKTNLKTLNAPAAQVVQRDSLQWLDQRVEQPFDIIFLDPPFKQGLMQLAVDKLFINGIIKNQQAWLYLEQEKSLDWPNLPDGWVCHREKTTSQVRFGLFRQV
ncbi:16S rRNA (guanine(966)-N(2))-methyltransferase RsmD [Thiomicrorhabdus arctica]|uniref:16S rRNA (guanine(966)-N(2))-methyltransferase RsmD n=1 Tax=Thiomicrorhabdus arctica TaxID=131540 RepID=UPI00037BEF2E